MKPNQRSLKIETLETRQMLAFTELGQLMLEHINRARANPLAEVARNPNVADLNQGVVKGLPITSTPKQPLVLHEVLQSVAEAHSEDMYSNEFFSHTGSTGSSQNSRNFDAGFDAMTNGENISFRFDTSKSSQELVLDSHSGLFTSPGHRQNLLRDDFREVGLATSIFDGPWTDGEGNSVPSGDELLLATQNFATEWGEPFPTVAPPYLTGVVINDTDNDDFYDIGEGWSGVTTAVFQDGVEQASTLTTTTGGYALQLEAGQYEIRATGNGVSSNASVTITDQNVKVDFETGVDPQPVAPVLAAISAQDAVVGQPLEIPITFTDADLPSDSHIVTDDWGDGTINDLADVTSPLTISHTYTDPGTFTAVVTVVDSTGRESQQGFVVTVVDGTVRLAKPNYANGCRWTQRNHTS